MGLADNSHSGKRASRFTTISPGKVFSARQEIKRSEFIGYAHRVADEDAARHFLLTLRRDHHSATHICHAFVVGADRQIRRSSDDGEPAGTAGMPILDAILKRGGLPAELSDVVVAVVRYFGGVKLGAGGLVQAYSGAAAAVLDAAVLVVRQRMQLFTMDVPHSDVGRLETNLRSLGFAVQATQYCPNTAIVTIAVTDEPDATDAALKQVQALTAGRGRPVPAGFDWVDLPLETS